MLRYAAAALAAFLLSAPVHAAEGCRPIETILAHLAKDSMPHLVYTGDEVKRAVDYYNAQPGEQIASADAIIVVARPGIISVIFTHGTEACEVIHMRGDAAVADFIETVLGRPS